MMAVNTSLSYMQWCQLLVFRAFYGEHLHSLTTQPFMYLCTDVCGTMWYMGHKIVASLMCGVVERCNMFY